MQHPALSLVRVKQVAAQRILQESLFTGTICICTSSSKSSPSPLHHSVFRMLFRDCGASSCGSLGGTDRGLRLLCHFTPFRRSTITATAPLYAGGPLRFSPSDGYHVQDHEARQATHTSAMACLLPISHRTPLGKGNSRSLSGTTAAVLLGMVVAIRQSRRRQPGSEEPPSGGSPGWGQCGDGRRPCIRCL